MPLIGFAGAPFTLAAYAIEGGPSTTLCADEGVHVRAAVRVARLCDRFASMVAGYLRAQVDAGAQAIQVFDSWAGRSRAPTTASSRCRTRGASSTALADLDVPSIHFGVGTTAILSRPRRGGRRRDRRGLASAARRRLDRDRLRRGRSRATSIRRLLLGPVDRLLAAADEVLRRANRRPGHIFNLGHGVLPSTPVEHVQELARHVHRGIS